MLMKHVGVSTKPVLRILEVRHWVATGLMVLVFRHFCCIVKNAEVSMDHSGLIMGVVVLCPSQYFVRGAQLEKDVDGLV